MELKIFEKLQKEHDMNFNLCCDFKLVEPVEFYQNFKNYYFNQILNCN